VVPFERLKKAFSPSMRALLAIEFEATKIGVENISGFRFALHAEAGGSPACWFIR
jgi:hypothetical protein